MWLLEKAGGVAFREGWGVAFIPWVVAFIPGVCGFYAWGVAFMHGVWLLCMGVWLSRFWWMERDLELMLFSSCQAFKPFFRE